MSQPEFSNSRRGLVVQKAHTDLVRSVAFSPDGKAVASVSFDKTIRIWNAQNLSPIGEPIVGPASSIYSISYSPSGRLIASGSKDKIIYLWDTNTGKQVGLLQGHSGDVNSVAFSPDGNQIASGSDDGTIRLWNVEGRSPAPDPFKGHTDFVWSVAFAPDGTRLVSGSHDHTIRIWDIQEGKVVIGPLERNKTPVFSVNFSPDGSQIVSGLNDGTLRLWDVRTGTTIGRPYGGHSSSVYSAAFSPNGMYVASGSSDNTICVWDVRTGRKIERYGEHTGVVYSVAFSPCSRRLVSGSGDNKVMISSTLSKDSEADLISHIRSEKGSDHDQGNDTNSVDRHMSIQDMFDRLLRHGCVDLTSQMDPKIDSAVLMFRKGFGDNWNGELRNGTKVQIKTWRAPLLEQCSYEILESAIKDINIWSKMKHKNIHQLIGVVMPSHHYLGLVSERMENGDLHEYMRKNPQFDRHLMCMQIALGLAYMHRHGMLHGNLKALNVMVSSGGVAKISNFAVSSLTNASISLSEAPDTETGYARWAAPELLSEGARKTKQSDVYALGMTILEVITGSVAYPQCRWEFQVLSKVMQGDLPTRPSNLKDDEYGSQIWDLLLSCWNKNPDVRPSAKDIFGSLALMSTD